MSFLSFYVEVKAFKLKCHLSCCVLLDEGLSSSSWAPWSWTNWKLHYCAKAVQRCYRIDEQSALSHCIFTETTANPANGSMKAFKWREQAILHQAKANIFDDLEKRYRDNKQTKLCKLPYISAGQARTAMMLCSTQSTSAPRGLGTIFMSNPAHLHKKNWNCQKSCNNFHNGLSRKIVALLVSVSLSALFYGEALYAEVYNQHNSLTSN